MREFLYLGAVLFSYVNRASLVFNLPELFDHLYCWNLVVDISDLCVCTYL